MARAQVEAFETEAALLEAFVAAVRSLDPDILVGYDVQKVPHLSICCLLKSLVNTSKVSAAVTSCFSGQICEVSYTQTGANACSGCGRHRP